MLKTDPIDWELDDDNQLIIPIRYTFGPKGVKQGARQRLSEARGEWFLNGLIGLPLLPSEFGQVTKAEAILGEAFDEAKVIAAIRSVLLTTPGLRTVTKIKVAYDNENRILRVKWEGVCIWGDTVSDELDLEDPANV